MNIKHGHVWSQNVAQSFKSLVDRNTTTKDEGNYFSGPCFCFGILCLCVVFEDLSGLCNI